MTDSQPIFSPLRVATLNAIQRGEFDDILHRIHFNWSMNRVQCRIHVSSGRDHVRPVNMVATPKYWYCPECKKKNQELTFPLAMVEACEREYAMMHSIDCRELIDTITTIT